MTTNGSATAEYQELVTYELTRMLAKQDAQRRMVGGDRRVPLAEREITDEAFSRPPAEPLIGNLLYRNTITLWFGAEGTFKSFIAMGAACAVATGQPWFGLDPLPDQADCPVDDTDTDDPTKRKVLKAARGEHVVYIAAEGGSGIRWRARGWAEQLGYRWSDVTKNLTMYDGFDLNSDEDMRELAELMRERRTALLVLDTKRRVSPGVPENGNTEQELIYRRVEDLQRETDAAILVVHHSNKVGEDLAGAGTWATNPWQVAKIARPSAGMVAELHQRKTKDMRCRRFAFDLEPHTEFITRPGDRLPEDGVLVARPRRNKATSRAEHTNANAARGVTAAARKRIDALWAWLPLQKDLPVKRDGTPNKAEIIKRFKSAGGEAVYVGTANSMIDAFWRGEPCPE
ncbi:AAA family ATPase [[Mycobacterium] zoologicum]|uniref:AAA family ATPase n=1 Tax=[Mycobacterium] zoologicum TaxID=2872311 RepID=UPI001CDAD35C|nr:AAA family ATPase [Mycolicibacter sp. MYC101]MEB3065397.1 AAA family ATPase [Mycolicibacter sp. MYC101]